MNINACQLGCSTFSIVSYVIIVWNVLCKPAFIPLGGSFVTLSVFYNKPNGNLGWASQVIHNLKSSCNSNLGAS